ncbi:hypothetical protein SPONN_807 [uncultured Candidatus Thioglobus sp.]|nr:hypothetical protein SPONN_807 [uncultured Candidatus Thioglobus sp.]
MPGPSEPKLTINTYLKPLIEDLQTLWRGVSISINGEQEKVRAAVSCLACDVPAARKVGGFVGHRGKHGCSKCMKEFAVAHFGDYPDYSGFDKSNWEPRTHALHVWYGLCHKDAKTEEAKRRLESISGARYTSLYELPYYTPISSCIVDPMHCLFLGIAKTFFKTWVAQNILTEDRFPLIQERVDAFNCPPDIGRIPYKIASKFSGLKADQWKNWTLYFSLYALKDLLPPRDYDCWLVFVKACSSICRREISVLELEGIDTKVQTFCEMFERLYGMNSLTPNMHLAGHITDCIRDHGPVYAFWLYAFERMNGILGSFQTNNHDVTIQLMRKFLNMQGVSLDQWPQDVRSEFLVLFQKCCKESGSLSETNFSVDTFEQKALPPVSEKAFQDHEMLKVEAVMCSLYPNSSIQVLRLYRSSMAFAFNDSIKLASNYSKYSKCSKEFVGEKLFEINHFLQCTVIADCTLVHCSPYISHQCKPWFGYPTQVWSPVLETDFDYFMLNQINSRVVFVQSNVNFGRVIGIHNVLVVSPIPLFT